MNNTRVVGRVLSVDNFRVYIKIEDNLQGAYISGIEDIYEVASVNSYLIIPVGADRVVAVITRISMKEEIEFDKNTSTISLPSAARYISATMLGTISGTADNEKFIQGVYNFPALDNPVWYVTKKDLQHIFDDKQERTNIKYSVDYYLPIGTSPIFNDYKVKICPDQFFVKHAAILGNTGSGKSCTLTSIIRNLFSFNYYGKSLENAHIVIFDTNGEYKKAFLTSNEKLDADTEAKLSQINAYYYGGDEQVKVPYWLMNWNDFKSLFKPSDGTQGPILNRAIGLAKNDAEAINEQAYSMVIMQSIEDIITQITVPAEDYWKIKNYADFFTDMEEIDLTLQNGKKLNEILSTIPNRDGSSYEKVKPSVIDKIVSELTLFLRNMEEENTNFQITSEQNIDLPIWFSYQELCTKFMDAAISQESTSNNRIAEFVSFLRLRMNSFLNDKRMAVPLMLKDNDENNKGILAHFIAFLLGDFNRFFTKDKTEHFVHTYNQNNIPKSSEKTSQITIIDVSLLPFEVLETVTALLGRIILEFVSHFLPDERGKYPIVIVLEEAQNYISEKSETVAKEVFERIAREGRKYGISLVVCSQRPSELSKTVLSQCNSFIIHRLQNPEDQKYIRGLVSSASADILDQLPIIPQQHAIVTGDCVRTPIQVRIDDVFPTPNSHNPKFIDQWLSDVRIPYEETCDRWIMKKTIQEDNSHPNQTQIVEV